MKQFLNYLGQLRVYSLIDVIIFATALTRSTHYVFGVALLWVSFLLYLEAQHQDKLRLRVRYIAWVVAYIPTFFLLPAQIPLLFGFFGILYTMKKRNKFFGATSPLWRGMMSFVMAYVLNPHLAFLAFALNGLRNLIGDFRDIGDDWENKTYTIPVWLGFRKNQTWAFFGHLICVLGTTYIWFQYSWLDAKWMIPLMIIQAISYPITPRSSNPKYLNFYKEF